MLDISPVRRESRVARISAPREGQLDLRELLISLGARLHTVGGTSFDPTVEALIVDLRVSQGHDDHVAPDAR